MALIPKVEYLDLRTLEEFKDLKWFPWHWKFVFKKADENTIKNVNARLSKLKRQFKYLRQSPVNVNELSSSRQAFHEHEHNFKKNGVYDTQLLVVDALRVLNIKKAYDLWDEGSYLEAFNAFEELNEEILRERSQFRNKEITKYSYDINYSWSPYPTPTGEHFKLRFDAFYPFTTRPFLNEQVLVLEDMIAPNVRVGDEGKLIIENKPESVVARGTSMLKRLLTQPEPVNTEKKPYEKPVYLDELKTEQRMLGLKEFKNSQLAPSIY